MRCPKGTNIIQLLLQYLQNISTYTLYTYIYVCWIPPVLSDGSVVGALPAPSVSQTLLEEMNSRRKAGASSTDVVDHLQLRCVPSGYTAMPWRTIVATIQYNNICLIMCFQIIAYVHMCFLLICKLFHRQWKHGGNGGFYPQTLRAMGTLLPQISKVAVMQLHPYALLCSCFKQPVYVGSV